MAANAGSVRSVKDKDEFEKLTKSEDLVVVHFMAPWAAQCESISNVLKAQSDLKEFKGVTFAEVEAESAALAQVSLDNQIASVPTVLYFRNGKCIDRVDGVKISEMTNKIKEHMKNSAAIKLTNDEPDVVPKPAEVEPIEERLKKLIKKDKIVLFMKGSPEQPRCGFSRTIIEILNGTGLPYGTFDILQDEEVRQSLKTFSDWHTYPQLYVNGELVGGLDIVKELQASGDLMPTLSG